MPQLFSIEFSFAYEGADRNALEEITFSVPSGSTVALVGPSGSGKSSAAALVPRFWDVLRGSVSVGGVDVRALIRKCSWIR